MKALVDLAATRLQSKAVSCGAESFSDLAEAHQFVLTESVLDGCEAWMGAVNLMVSGETDITTLDESLQQELTSGKTGKSIDKLVQSSSFRTLGGLPSLLGGEATKRTDSLTCTVWIQRDTLHVTNSCVQFKR